MVYPWLFGGIAMRIAINDKPRIFGVRETQIKDYGKVIFEPWEMLSLQLEPGKDCDITATDWGFYLGSSTNGRMKRNGYRVAIVKNDQGKLFVNAVDESRKEVFEQYLENQDSIVVQWLD